MNNEQLIFKYEQDLMNLLRNLARTHKFRLLKRLLLKITILEVEQELLYLKKIRDNNSINLN